MWNMIDQWIVVTALLWSLWVIVRKLSKKAFLSCETPCDKKLFNKKPELIGLRRKTGMAKISSSN